MSSSTTSPVNDMSLAQRNSSNAGNERSGRGIEQGSSAHASLTHFPTSTVTPDPHVASMSPLLSQILAMPVAISIQEHEGTAKPGNHRETVGPTGKDASLSVVPMDSHSLVTPVVVASSRHGGQGWAGAGG